MIFTQYYLDCLSQGSYLIGDESTGRAVVVDPRRDIDEYLNEAAEHGLQIERVIETHIHADFLTGHLELAAATGAVITYSEDADVEFPVESLKDGQRISLGEVTLEILATPGHTPESICIVVYEHPDDEVPYGVLTGDTLFVGDVGRPDLLAGTGLSADTLARTLYGSLHDKILKLPDATRVFPAHGAGSACGKQMSSETSSTIGEQRRDNYALQLTDVDEFVAAITEGQSPRPHYFEFDSLRNRELRPLLDENPPPLLDVYDVYQHANAGAICWTPGNRTPMRPVICAVRSTSVCRDASPRPPAKTFRPTATSSWSAILNSRLSPRSASAAWVSTGSLVNYATCQVFSRNGGSRRDRFAVDGRGACRMVRVAARSAIGRRPQPGGDRGRGHPRRAEDPAADPHRFARAASIRRRRSSHTAQAATDRWSPRACFELRASRRSRTCWAATMPGRTRSRPDAGRSDREVLAMPDARFGRPDDAAGLRRVILGFQFGDPGQQ